MKLICVVIDGMGDLPIEDLGNQTPLAKAPTPNMDYLARNGKTGLIYTVGEGIAPESDVGVVSILGYDPRKYDTSRGVLEAVGSGMAFQDGDLAVRCNFATLGPEGKIVDRRAGRDVTEGEAEELRRSVNARVKLESHPATFEFKNTIGHRGVLIIRSNGLSLSGRITNTDPAYRRVGGMGVAVANPRLVLQKCEPTDGTEAARISAALLNEFVDKSHKVLEQSNVNTKRLVENKLSANVLLTRDAGHLLPKFFNINEMYGVQFCCLADMPLEIGIARLVGMHTVDLPPPSGDLVEDCKLRVEELLTALRSYDCFYIHIKGPDEPGHDGNFALKTQMMATIDECFFKELVPRINLEELIICVTADHATPCKLRTHSDTPVPILIAGDNIRGSSTRFSEDSCRNGSLGIIEHGFELMPTLMAFFKQS